MSQQAEAYSDILIRARELFVPTKQITIRPCDQPWVNSYTRLLLRKKNRNYHIFKRDSCKLTNAISKDSSPELVTRLSDKKQTSYKRYRSAANESCKGNRRAKLAFYNSVNATMQSANISAKKKFSILTKLMRTQKVSSVPPIIENGEIITDSQEKANIFNNFFAEKATVSGNNDQVPPLLPREDIMSPIRQFNTSPFELGHLIRNIKKSNNSHCGIPGKFLAIIATPVSFQLYKVFNNMFAEGIFPDVFKIGHICCIYKGLSSGLKSSKSSWRPITLLPTLSKLAESVLHKRLLDHFLEHNVISHRQAAYLKGDSTIQQVLYIVHMIRTAWSKKAIMQGVFLDVSAAFDKAWHSGLIAKLEQIKIQDSALQLFKSYLSNRVQITVIDSKKSTEKQILAGVPQGSRLGPLLWIMYYNDILEGLNCEVLIFADDICIFAQGNTPEQTAQMLNDDLAKISYWASKWKVNFNPSKTKNMLFSHKIFSNVPPILFNNTIVKQVQEHKHLGIWLTPTLCWSKQIHEICLRANSKLAVLRSVSYLSRSTLDLLYKLQIRSVIDYGLCIFYNSLKQSDIYRLNQIQYRAGKLVTGALHYTSCSKLFLELGWEELSSRAKFLGLTVFHKIHLGITRPLVKTCMPSLRLNQNNTRATVCYERFQQRSVQFSKSFFPYFSQLWSSLNKNIKCINDLTKFKENLSFVYKPTKNQHFKYGSKIGNRYLTHLRLGRSFLNSHRFVTGLSDNIICSNCNENQTENTSHFVQSCPSYNLPRVLLMNKITNLIPNFSSLGKKVQLDILLNGINTNSIVRDCRNVPIMFAMQSFILSTKRFEKRP